jgi:hypothetical protein
MGGDMPKTATRRSQGIRNTWNLILIIIPFGLTCWFLYSAADALFVKPVPTIDSNDWFVLSLRFSDVVKVMVLLSVAGYGYYHLPAFPRPYGVIIRTIAVLFPFVAVATIILVYALGYRYLGVVDNGQTNPNPDPVTCVYLSLVTWTTLGYGDVTPMPQIRLFAASEAFVGYLGMAMFVALFVQAIDRFRRPTQGAKPDTDPVAPRSSRASD